MSNFLAPEVCPGIRICNKIWNLQYEPINLSSPISSFAPALRGLRAFLKDYPDTKAFMLYGGNKKMWESGIQIVPVVEFLKDIVTYLKS
ncbi:hypothetical protein HZA42_04750 [Candidatus Peregrinibacteria bacterium]|nr:hypothetical protein [Candidatus Peregrinibacteria bacterium]